MVQQPRKLAATLRRRTTDLLAVGIILVMTLSVGRWLATGTVTARNLWDAATAERRVAEPEPPCRRSENAGSDPAGRPRTSEARPEETTPWRTVWSVRFGKDGERQLEHRIARGEWTGIRRALVADCQSFLERYPPPASIDASSTTVAPPPLPLSLAARSAVAGAAGRWRVDVITEGPPIVLGSVREAATSQWRVVVWSVAIPAGSDGWDIYVSQFSTASASVAPAASPPQQHLSASAPHRREPQTFQAVAPLPVQPPPGGRLVLHVGRPDMAEVALYAGTGTVEAWCRHFDRILAPPAGSVRQSTGSTDTTAADHWRRLSEGAWARTARVTANDAEAASHGTKRPCEERLVRVVVRATDNGSLRALVTATPP